jgi:hypothetical protein
MSRLRTTHEWICSIEPLSDVVASLDLRKTIKDASLKADAFNFANDKEHRVAIASAFQNLSSWNGYRDSAVSQLAAQLFGRQTGGAFGELFVYDWLVRAKLPANMQIQRSSQEVLCGNGSELDGSFDFYWDKVFFDVKSFGLQQRVVDALKKRLEEFLPDMTVHITESWDVSVETFEQLVTQAQRVAACLHKDGMYREGPVVIRVEAKKQVSISSRVLNPYLLAQENAAYPLRYAHKFTRNDPFILVFVVHPWLGGLDLQNDFSDTATKHFFSSATTFDLFIRYAHRSSIQRALEKRPACCRGYCF